MQKHQYNIAVLVLIGAFILSACGSSAGKATPSSTPVDVGAIQTAAVQTVIARITQEAPTITPTPAYTDTPVPTKTPKQSTPPQTPVTPTVSLCKNMAYVADVTIPDGTQLAVGQAFTKTWTIQNTGTCEWTTTFKLVYSYGDLMSGQTVSLAKAVPAGEKTDISVNLKVPNMSGKLAGYWVLVDENGQHFGSILTVVINVSTPSSTPTGTATPTVPATATPTLAATETPSPTP
jgi:hypothetical protein